MEHNASSSRYILRLIDLTGFLKRVSLPLTLGYPDFGQLSSEADSVGMRSCSGGSDLRTSSLVRTSTELTGVYGILAPH